MVDDIKYVYGIDLGTTYSCIACIDKDGLPTVLKNVEGEATTPSVVSFNGDNEFTVGDVAKQNAVLEPDTTVAFVKRLMGKADTAIEYNGRVYSPAEISALILRKVAEDAAKVTGQEVKDVVITVPAYFGDAERNATKVAGELAGLNVLGIINEPTAAAICYGVQNAESEKNVLVYDLGGGTFDVSILKIENNKITEVCHDGDDTLGGKDWDDRLVNYLKEQFTAESGVEEFEPEDEQELLLIAEKTKKQLSGKDKVPVAISAGGERGRVEVTRETFDAITADLLKRTFDVVDRAFGIAESKGVRKDNIDQILLVGGSTSMPQVEKAIVDEYNITPQIFDPHHAVAKGAAIKAYDLYRNQKAQNDDGLDCDKEGKVLPPPPGGDENGSGIIITGCTTKSYGLKLYDSNSKDYYIYNMILKNSEMENGVFSVTEGGFTTLEDNQTSVQIEIYESDTMEKKCPLDVDLKLGDGLMELPSGLKAGEPKLSVTFKLTGDGTLDISSIYEKDGKTYDCKFTLNASGVENYSEEKAQMIQGLTLC